MGGNATSIFTVRYGGGSDVSVDDHFDVTLGWCYVSRGNMLCWCHVSTGIKANQKARLRRHNLVDLHVSRGDKSALTIFHDSGGKVEDEDKLGATLGAAAE